MHINKRVQNKSHSNVAPFSNGSEGYLRPDVLTISPAPYITVCVAPQPSMIQALAEETLNYLCHRKSTFPSVLSVSKLVTSENRIPGNIINVVFLFFSLAFCRILKTCIPSPLSSDFFRATTQLDLFEIYTVRYSTIQSSSIFVATAIFSILLGNLGVNKKRDVYLYHKTLFEYK